MTISIDFILKIPIYLTKMYSIIIIVWYLCFLLYVLLDRRILNPIYHHKEYLYYSSKFVLALCLTLYFELVFANNCCNYECFYVVNDFKRSYIYGFYCFLWAYLAHRDLNA